MELNPKNIKKILLIVFLSAIIVFAIANLSQVAAFVSQFISLFTPVIAALCIAFVLNVLLVPFETKVFKFMDKSKYKFIQKLKRPICLILTYLIAFGLISTIILVVIPDIIDTVKYLVEKLPSFIAGSRTWLGDVYDKLGIDQSHLPEINWQATANAIAEWLNTSSTHLFGGAVNITTSLFSGIYTVVFSLVISIYILAQKEKIGNFIKRTLEAFLPQKTTKLIYHISYKTSESYSRFISGQALEAVILGTLCYICMIVFRMPNALIISVIISITSFVPIVGPTVGAIIGFLLIVITDPLKAVLFVIFFLILQQLEGNLIYPKVVGKVVGLPGVIVLSAVMVGGNIGGVFGSLIAVPTSAVFYTLLKEAVEYQKQKKKTLKS